MLKKESLKGKNFAFVGLTDENNQFEITLFSDILFKVRDFFDSRAFNSC